MTLRVVALCAAGLLFTHAVLSRLPIKDREAGYASKGVSRAPLLNDSVQTERQ